MELGGRVHYTDPSLGLTLDAAVGACWRTKTLTTTNGGQRLPGLAPGAAGQGLSLTLAPTWGAAASGMDGLWTRQTTAGLAQTNRSAPTGRLNAEVGYGFIAPFGTGLLTPYAGTVFTDGAGRTYRVGTRLERGQSHGADGEGQRNSPANSPRTKASNSRPPGASKPLPFPLSPAPLRERAKGRGPLLLSFFSFLSSSTLLIEDPVSL